MKEKEIKIIEQRVYSGDAEFNGQFLGYIAQSRYCSCTCHYNNNMNYLFQTGLLDGSNSTLCLSITEILFGPSNFFEILFKGKSKEYKQKAIIHDSPIEYVYNLCNRE